MRLLLALLLLFSSSSWASFPATATVTWSVFKSSGTWYGTATSQQDACQKAGLTWQGPPNYCMPGYVVPQVYSTAYSCPANSTKSGSTCTCSAGYVESGASCIIPPPVCPTAGTSAGAYHFTVPAGGTTPETFQEYDGPCVLSTGTTVCTVAADGSRHCTAETTHTGQACPPGGCTGSGSSSSGPAPSPTKDAAADSNGPCQPGYYYGTVNGSVVCVPGQGTESKTSTSTTTTTPAGTESKTQTTVTSTGTSPNGTKTTQTTQTTLEQQWSAARQVTFQSESSVPTGAIAPTTAGQTTKSTVTNPDGSKTEYTLTKQADGSVTGTAKDGTTVQKTDTTTCTGSSCTTNSTTATNGSQTGSTSGTTTKDGLCKDSPDNAQCGDGDGMFAGTCSAGFQCDGDAVQCAMAKKQHETSCALLENKSAESQLYDAEKGKTGDVTGSNPNNSTQAIGSGMFDYSSATGGGACITDKTITVMGRSIQLPFSGVCPWLDVLGNILVSVSSLVALRIVMRG